MRDGIRWLMMFVLCMAVTVGAAAEAAFIPELSEWSWESMPVEVELHADVQTHMPYDDARLQQLNAMLGHLSLKVHLQQLGGEQWSRMSLLVDDQEVLTALQREMAYGTEAQFSTAPDSTYVWSADSGMDMISLLGGESSELWLTGSELSWMDDALALMDAAVQAMPDYLTDQKYLVTIENMGKATRKQTLTIPKSAAAELTTQLAELCPDGMLKTMLQDAVFSGKQTLTLWRNSEGQILRADWSGNAGLTADDLRQVSLVWRLCREDEQVRDDLTLKTPKVKGSGRNNLIIQRIVKQSGDQATLDLTITRNTLQDGVKTVVTGQFDLTRELEAGHSHVTGSMDIQRQVNDASDVEQLLIQPDVVFAGAQEQPAVSGQLAVSQYLNKNLQEQATITLNARQADWMMWELRSSQITINDETREVQARKLLNGMTVELVRRLVLLPQEDTLFLSDGLDEDIWKQIVQAAQSALQ